MARALLLAGLVWLVGCESSVVVNDDADRPGADQGSGNACVVESMLTERCASCHGALPSEGAPMPLRTLHDLRVRSAVDGSLTQAQRSLVRMRDAGSPMPPAPAARAPTGEIASLEGWIGEGMPTCLQGEDGGSTVVESPNLLPQADLFVCTDGVRSDAPTRLRRMNRREFTRNAGGSVMRSWTGFSFFDNPLDPSAGEQYSTWASDETMDEATIELFLPVLAEAATPWTMNYPEGNRLERVYTNRELSCMFDEEAPSAGCVDYFLRDFLQYGVFFRPPADDELARLTAFTGEVLAQETSFSPEARAASITRISNAAWMMTGALFRNETGTEADGRAVLSPWELGQQLAYAIGSRAPGATPSFVWPYYSAGPEGHLAEIAAAARDGSIADDATVEAVLRTNLGGSDPDRMDLIQDFGDEERRARRGEHWLSDGVATFFREWLDYGAVETIFKETPAATSAFDTGELRSRSTSSYENLLLAFHGKEPTFVQQVDDMVARVVAADRDVLRELLTTRTFYLSSTDGSWDSQLFMGHPFNLPEVLPATRESRWRTLPATERSGVLTHPAWLAAHGGNFEDDPSIVHRGKWIRENLLCDYVPPLSSVQVAAQVGDHAPELNARRRLAAATAGVQCQGCHRLMDPLGLPFEIYNHAGYLRARDHGADGGWTTPDGSSILTAMPDPALDGPVADAIELMEKLADSQHVKRCFVRQTFRYFIGRPENLTDACTLTNMEQAYDSAGGSFRSMLLALMTSDTWKTRRIPEAGE